MPSHGSASSDFARFSAFARSNAPPVFSRAISSQCSGMATGAPALARSDQPVTLVAPRVLRAGSA